MRQRSGPCHQNRDWNLLALSDPCSKATVPVLGSMGIRCAFTFWNRASTQAAEFPCHPPLWPKGGGVLELSCGPLPSIQTTHSTPVLERRRLSQCASGRRDTEIGISPSDAGSRLGRLLADHAKPSCAPIAELARPAGQSGNLGATAGANCPHRLHAADCEFPAPPYRQAASSLSTPTANSQPRLALPKTSPREFVCPRPPPPPCDLRDYDLASQRHSFPTACRLHAVVIGTALPGVGALPAYPDLVSSEDLADPDLPIGRSNSTKILTRNLAGNGANDTQRRIYCSCLWTMRGARVRQSGRPL